ncbi:MAG: hypothetical protein F6K47_04385 [Symploca sp. SIO2E6]|nr:hypothetical protein [Symploca sp. SIO2E6]
MATTEYTFNLRNLQANPVTMWLFLEAPQFSTPPQNVFQNSDTFLQVTPYDPTRTQKFESFVQYSMGVGAQTDPVVVGNVAKSSQTISAELNKGYLATYGSSQGDAPGIVPGKTRATPTETNLVVDTNVFSPVQNWNNSMTFGVKTSSGSTGVTWVPNPNFEYVITPILTFFVAVGNYSVNKLAQIQAGSLTNAVLKTGPGGDFDQFNNTYITYEQDGTWSTQKTPWSV